MTTSDLSFITNENGENLLKRFQTLLSDDTRLFDCLVGYFYSSGFNKLYPSLEKTEKIRILIGMKTNFDTFDLIEQSHEQTEFHFSHKKMKEEYGQAVQREMENSEDNIQVEEGVYKFIEWLKSGKLEIRAYPSENIHAKLYIMTFHEGDRDKGRVITGSSNFTQSGLVDNLEFNVELTRPSDYDFAIYKFNELWDKSVNVSKEFISTIVKKTWLNDSLNPYQLYLKFLYEYLKEKINLDQLEENGKYLPKGFMELEYQKYAVADAKQKLNEFNGVFLADVVGLGKTYISALLAHELSGRSLIICPPVLVTYWEETFEDFNLPKKVESLGKLDYLLKEDLSKYSNIFIDEAHRFRNESNQTYAKLKQICWGKKVILVSATPQNNTPLDLLSLIKLFQKGRNSTIPAIKDIDSYFHKLQDKVKAIDRIKEPERYLTQIRENAKDIRERVLKHLMVRRTRKEIEQYFSKDMKNQNLKFPKVSKPQRVYYVFDHKTEKVFSETINIIKKFKYSRYTPLLYLKKPDLEEESGQRNMRKFMKILLVKRLESSFYAFRNTIDRFILSYEKFIRMCETGDIYISKKYTEKIYDLLDDDDTESILKLVEEENITHKNIKEFIPEFIDDLKGDLKLLKQIRDLWRDITADPKLTKLKKALKEEKYLKGKQILVFTESRETAEYLEENLSKTYSGAVLACSSQTKSQVMDDIKSNYDPKSRTQADTVKILIATEVLSEGINLQKSNVVVNYDLPWNPTRVIQRVGRINRVDTKHSKIHIYNFFPTQQSDNEIGLESAAIGKIQSFHDILGDDSAYISDGEEVSPKELFNKVNSSSFLEGENGADPEQYYLKVIRDIRDKDSMLFSEIKQLPKKSRTARKSSHPSEAVLCFFRKGKIRKIFISDGILPRELDFLETAKILECSPEEKKEKLSKQFYELLEANKKAFNESLLEEDLPPAKAKGGKTSTVKLLQVLKALKGYEKFTDDEEDYLAKVYTLLDEGIIPKKTIQIINKEIEKCNNVSQVPGIIRRHLPDAYFQVNQPGSFQSASDKREVILSEYLIPQT